MGDEVRRWGIGSAGLGGLAWLAAPLVPVAAPPPFGAIEHVFLFMPLVAAPLALVLVTTLVHPEGGPPPRLYGLAQRLQPLTAVMMLASFFLAQGTAAGALAAGWLAMTILAAVGGLRGLRFGTGTRLANVSLRAALVFLPVGAVWLLLSRLGVSPRSLPALNVFLAALHFHFSGFTLQVLIAATARRLEGAPSRLRTLHGCVGVATMAALVLIAAGNAMSSPALKFAGVASMVLGASTLAVTATAAAILSRSRVARTLLFVSAASLGAAMVVAGVYGVGEVTGAGWIGISRMVKVHGLVNALGFTLCALGGHLREGS